jgi:Ca2+-binding RTX toxin-like protein
MIWGGAGNDSLWGDDGADMFIYAKGDGKDIIFGFDNKDTLTFDNITFKTSMASYDKSKGTITINVSGGSVTLKDFTATTFHINDDTYKISGSTLKKQ